MRCCGSIALSKQTPKASDALLETALKKNTLLTCGRFSLDLSAPKIMAILNLTEDSFSGDGLASNTEKAWAKAQRALEEGADVLDIGAESTRPGARPIPADEELRRLRPLIERVLPLNVPLSIDTLKPEVMQAVLAMGVDMINDVKGFSTPGAFEAVAPTSAALCIMHMQGEPAHMQENPHYHDPVREVACFLKAQAHCAQTKGIASTRLVLDPGFGFGKTQAHNLALLRGLPELAALGYPLLVGLSRKSLLGQITGAPVDDRLPASLMAAAVATQNGARLLRVHDVKATRQALQVLEAIRPWT